eukprot:2873728-Pleurochrysis_carterae.AAC.1
MTPAVTRAVKRTALAMREMKGQGKGGAVRSLREAGGGSAGSSPSMARGVSVLELGARKERDE